MKKIFVLLLSAVFLSGCATYKFQHGEKPYDKGYVASRDGHVIPEYTLGKDNTVPPRVKLAKERFNRRRDIVEDYYKRMGYIENHFKMLIWDNFTSFLKVIGGIFTLPSVGISDYKYDHDPAYRAKMDKLDQENEQKEHARIDALKADLNKYILKDLEIEPAVQQIPAAKEGK